VIREHVNAILGRLREDAGLADIVFQGVVTDRPKRYCSVFVDNGFRDQERLTGGQWTADFSITVHSVGTTPEQAQWVAERVYAQLLGVRLTIPGRRARPVRAQGSQPVRVDADVSPPLFYTVDEFGLTTSPA